MSLAPAGFCSRRVVRLRAEHVLARFLRGPTSGLGWAFGSFPWRAGRGRVNQCRSPR